MEERKPLKETIMSMDENLAADEADLLIKNATAEMMELIEQGQTEEAYNICENYFGLEPDYLDDLLLG